MILTFIFCADKNQMMFIKMSVKYELFSVVHISATVHSLHGFDRTSPLDQTWFICAPK